MNNFKMQTIMKTTNTIKNFAKRFVAVMAVVLLAGNVWGLTAVFTWGTNPGAYTEGSSDFSQGDVHFVGGNASGNTNTRAWSDGLRMYNGGTATFSVPNGYVITKIEGYNSFNYEDTDGEQSVEFTGLTKTTCKSNVTVTYSATGGGCTGNALVMTTVTATPGDEQVTLSWDAVTGATKYQVKWGTAAWADVNTNSYTKTGLTNGEEYTYQVKAIGNGTTTCDSDPTDAATVKPGLCYKVSFSTGEDNPEVASKTESEYGDGITLPAGPTPLASGDGWVFAGWGKAEVSNVTVAPRLYMPNDYYYPEGNETLYAVYRKLTSGTSTAVFTSGDRSNLTQLSEGVTGGAWWIHTATGVEFYIKSYGIYQSKFDIYKSWALIDAHTKIQKVDFTISGSDKINSVELNDAEAAAGGSTELTNTTSPQTITCSGDVYQLILNSPSNGDSYFTSFTVTYYNAKYHSNPVPCAVDPTVGNIMNAVSAISSTGATFSTSAGVSAGTGCDLTAVGFVYGSTTEPTLDDNVAIIDNYTSGALNKSVTGLTPNETYYVRAYATNSHGTKYSDEKQFTTLQRYDITYNNNGGAGSIAATTKDHGADFTLPANAGSMSKEGYHIADWKLGSASGTSYALGGTYDGNADAEFYAGWESNPYQVIFHKNGGQGENMTNQSFNYDEAQNLKANTYAPAEGSHKYFTGWNTQPNGSGTPYADKASVQNLVTSGTITLYAQWADHTYTNYRTTCCTKYDITAETPENGSFTVKDGDDDVDKACATTTITIAATPASDSYVFNHWSIVDGELNDITESLLGENPPASTSFEMPAKAITINAVFNLKTTEYAVTLHDNNGGEHNGSATVSTNGTVLSNISLPTKEGYHVAGYYLEAGCETLVANAAGTLQANVDGVTDENAQFIKGAAITLYAAWEGNQYTVTISKNYTETTRDYTATFGAAMPDMSDFTQFTRAGYTLTGIFANNDGTGTKYYDENKASAHVWDQPNNATIYAGWSPKNYTITLNNEGADTGHEGTISIAVTYDSDENLTSAIEKPERAGYKFCGYFTEAAGAGTQLIGEDGNVIASVSNFTSSTKQWKKAGDVELHAFWKACHTVTWSVNAAETPEVVVHGEKVAAMPDPAPTSAQCDDSKTFVGWRAEKITGTSATNPGSIFTTVGAIFARPNLPSAISYFVSSSTMINGTGFSE